VFLKLFFLQKALEEEKVAKGKSLAKRTELDSLLEKTIKSLDNVTAEKEMTKATLTDTQKDLEKEKKAGAALGEQVIDLSKQLEDQTARAVKAEGKSKQLQKGVVLLGT
jgi:cell division septum initiation protein DivIVA